MGSVKNGFVKSNQVIIQKHIKTGKFTIYEINLLIQEFFHEEVITVGTDFLKVPCYVLVLVLQENMCK